MSTVVDSVLEEMFKKCKQKAIKEAKVSVKELQRLTNENIRLKYIERRNERFLANAEDIVKNSEKIKETLKGITGKVTLNNLVDRLDKLWLLTQELNDSVSELKRSKPKPVRVSSKGKT